MNDFCGIDANSEKEEAKKRRIGRLRWRAAKMAVILGGFLYEGKKELGEEDKKIIAQTKKWLEETGKVYCGGGIENLENIDVGTCVEIDAILAIIKFIEEKIENKNIKEYLLTAFDLFIGIANNDKEKYFLDKLINTNFDGYCMIKYLSGEIEI